jgi:hypothetical protein
MGRFTYVTDLEKRQEIAKMFFGPFDNTLANIVPHYDVLTFLNRERLSDLELMLPDPYVSQKAMTRECVKLIEERTGRTLIKNHDPRKYLDPISQEVFDEYVNVVGGIDQFKRLYVG